MLSEQLRFHRIDDPPSSAHAVTTGYRQSREPVPLAEVPPRVFSEVMRDVELFIMASSVASDPSWDFGGSDSFLAHYRDDVAFGPLTATGRTRQAALARLIPSTTLAERCSVGERFVEVLGSDEQRYAIHIGTANVRVSEDHSPVVVSVRGKHNKSEVLTLPYEGDAMLSTIVAKAFALVGDAPSATSAG